jgi:CO dehydrogenase nickel-insertion accessory protein CooC1
MNGSPLSGLRIGIFGKGGSGKSTMTVFLARALRERGHSVLVLDADSTNVGLAEALGVDHQPDPLLDHFGGMVFSGGAVTCPVDDPTPLHGARLRLDEIPARFVGRTPEGILLLEAGKIGALGPGAGCDGPVAKIARDLHVSDFGPDPVTLIDYKAGFEDAARGTVTSIDWAVAVVDPTNAGLRMAAHLTGMVDGIRRGVPPATRHLELPQLVDAAIRQFAAARIRGVLPVLNRVRTPFVETYLIEALREEGLRSVGAFEEIPCVSEQWMRGEPLRSEKLHASARDLVAALETAAAAGAPPHPGSSRAETPPIVPGGVSLSGATSEGRSFADVPGHPPWDEDRGEEGAAPPPPDRGASFAEVPGAGWPR